MTLRKTSTERLRHHRMLFWSYPQANLSISTTSSSIPCNGKSVYQTQFNSYFTWFCAEASFACSKRNFYQNVCVFLTKKKNSLSIFRRTKLRVKIQTNMNKSTIPPLKFTRLKRKLTVYENPIREQDWLSRA